MKNTNNMKGKKIFITGGAGFLGKNIVKRLNKDNKITVYSRDEAKHYYMKKEFPDVNFIVGDIRNRDLLMRKSRNHDVGIFAASLKQIEACTDNYEEASKIIIDGAINSRLVAEENNFESACFISTDKSRAATTLYGAMKYVGGESFIVGESNVKLTTAIYGNVMNSTGSIIPLIWTFINNKKTLSLYGAEMTRFCLDIQDAIDLVMRSPYHTNCNLIPKARSFKVLDLFEIYAEQFGLVYQITQPRTGEKIHEIMASSEEVRRMEDKGELYLLHPDRDINELKFKNNEYSSRDCCYTKEELLEYLKEKNFYRP